MLLFSFILLDFCHLYKWVRFSILSLSCFLETEGGALLSKGAELSEGQGGAKFSEGAKFSRAAMFFCKRVISVVTLPLIIHTFMDILISLI